MAYGAASDRSRRLAGQAAGLPGKNVMGSKSSPVSLLPLRTLNLKDPPVGLETKARARPS